MNFPSARFISPEKSKQEGFWRQRQRRDLAPAQAIGLGLGKADHPSPERAAQTSSSILTDVQSIRPNNAEIAAISDRKPAPNSSFW
jgi:hypothetical protein